MAEPEPQFLVALIQRRRPDEEGWWLRWHVAGPRIAALEQARCRHCAAQARRCQPPPGCECDVALVIEHELSCGPYLDWAAGRHPAPAADQAHDWPMTSEDEARALAAEIETEALAGRLTGEELDELAATGFEFSDVYLNQLIAWHEAAQDQQEQAAQLASLSEALNAIDLAYPHGARRQAQDAEPTPRRTQERLDRAYERIAASTYLPSAAPGAAVRLVHRG